MRIGVTLLGISLLFFLFIACKSFSIDMQGDDTEVSIHDEDDDLQELVAAHQAKTDCHYHLPSNRHFKRHFFIRTKTSKKFFTRAIAGDINSKNGGTYQGTAPPLAFGERHTIARPFYYTLLHLRAVF